MEKRFLEFGENEYNELISEIKVLADTKYREFHSKLIPGIASEFLGVRVPVLRKVAKKIANEDIRGFLSIAKESNIYEIIMLYGMVIGLAKMDFNEKLLCLDKFVPKIDNWAVCDICVGDMKDIKKNKFIMFEYLQKYINSNKEYELRFAIVVLMQYFIEDEYIDKVLEIYNNIKHDGYYVKMAVAWGVSICFVKYREKTITYLRDLDNCKLDKFTYNKSLQKIRESNRVSKEDKDMVKGWKKD